MFIISSDKINIRKNKNKISTNMFDISNLQFGIDISTHNIRCQGVVIYNENDKRQIDIGINYKDKKIDPLKLAIVISGIGKDLIHNSEFSFQLSISLNKSFKLVIDNYGNSLSCILTNNSTEEDFINLFKQFTY